MLSHACSFHRICAAIGEEIPEGDTHAHARVSQHTSVRMCDVRAVRHREAARVGNMDEIMNKLFRQKGFVASQKVRLLV
jgi:hypothetical protein